MWHSHNLLKSPRMSKRIRSAVRTGSLNHQLALASLY
ncbi:predicted protein [Plenodomus lingam JN3]|uniref:Uncharacterized protein n=1 Tax=Leptosphaeria maculans (strain JN3 / isolate v23.1.3 / race Av1-4-5-6-7-8) TaxID=985895 RepID=E4ZGM7_LEPMJ|nr:predicted protein [Plenodomus lingam JN3]CBX90447.1 predicted protein [Plenodomus lingam JN3]